MKQQLSLWREQMQAHFLQLLRNMLDLCSVNLQSHSCNTEAALYLNTPSVVCGTSFLSPFQCEYDTESMTKNSCDQLNLAIIKT